MSNKERCIALLDAFSEEQLEQVAAVLQSMKNLVVRREEDEFCDAVYGAYQSGFAMPANGDDELPDVGMFM